MSPLLDLVLTVAGFVVALAGVLAVLGIAPFAMLISDGLGPDSPRVQFVLVIAAIVLPPVAVIGVFAAGVVVAWRADGLRWGYPILTIVAGVLVWLVLATVIDRWFDRAGLRPGRARTDPYRGYAVAGTARELTAEQVVAELDGQVVDDRLLLRTKVVVTPRETPRRQRSLARGDFDAAHRVFTVSAGAGLPEGWRVERSQIPAGAHGPGGGIQYVFLAPAGQTASYQELTERGFLIEAPAAQPAGGKG